MGDGGHGEDMNQFRGRGGKGVGVVRQSGKRLV